MQDHTGRSNMTIDDHTRKHRSIHDCKRISDHTWKYKYIHAGPQKNIQDISRPYRTRPYRTVQDHTWTTIQDHTGPYKTIHTHTRPQRTILDHRRSYKRKQVCTKPKRAMCLSGTHSLTQSGYFTHIELPTQLKKEKILEIVFVKHIMIMK